ncbi:hypothetical protein ACC693_38355, partial [Rhizobium ruizarguesonis]
MMAVAGMNIKISTMITTITIKGIIEIVTAITIKIAIVIVMGTGNTTGAGISIATADAAQSATLFSNPSA